MPITWVELPAAVMPFGAGWLAALYSEEGAPMHAKVHPTPDAAEAWLYRLCGIVSRREGGNHKPRIRRHDYPCECRRPECCGCD